MNPFRLIMPVAVLGMLLVSCGSQRKTPDNYNYLQAVSDSAIRREVSVQDPVIQKYDLLSIQVYSASSKPEADLLFNQPAGTTTSGNGTSGYLVDAQGNIEFPRIGTVKAEGLTKAQLAASLKTKIEETKMLISPSVIIRYLSYKVTVLGEVKQEGVYNVPNERITILEAIGLAGGITVDGKKTVVKVMREVNGKRETGVVDLTEKNLFESPYYYLMQNDVVTVDMTRRKAKQGDQQNSIQKVSLIAGLVTAVVLVYNTFK